LCGFFAAILARPLMQFMPSEHQPPFPFIREADAFDEIIGAGIERMKIAKARLATTVSKYFMTGLLLPNEPHTTQPATAVAGRYRRPAAHFSAATAASRIPQMDQPRTCH
jgi:hypothetical protein